MKRPPRSPKERVFNRGMIIETIIAGAVIGIVGFAAWCYLLNAVDIDVTSARSLLLLLMVLFENVHVFNCRSESVSTFRISLSRNWFLVIAVLAAQGVQILAMHVGFLQRLLETSPVSPLNWSFLFLLSLSVLLAVEVYKYMGARNRHGPLKGI